MYKASKHRTQHIVGALKMCPPHFLSLGTYCYIFNVLFGSSCMSMSSRCLRVCLSVHLTVSLLGLCPRVSGSIWLTSEHLAILHEVS